MPSFTPDTNERRNRRETIVAVLFFCLAIFLIYLPVAQQQQLASTLRLTVLRPFILTQETIAEARIRGAETSDLRQELDSLTSILANQVTLAEENARLRHLLDLKRRVNEAFEAASVIRPGTEGSESMFLLDVGAREGVYRGAPVIMQRGLVGVVREVRTSGSIGMDWTHPDFRASAMTADGATYGMVEPRRGDFREEDRLVLTGTPFYSVVEDGTWVLTSGRGGVYPRGIRIGTIEGLAESDGGWRRSYWIRPAVEVGSVTHALVALRGDGSGPGEIDPEAFGVVHEEPFGLPGFGESAPDSADVYEGAPGVSDGSSGDAAGPVESEEAPSAPPPSADAAVPPPGTDQTQNVAPDLPSDGAPEPELEGAAGADSARAVDLAPDAAESTDVGPDSSPGAAPDTAEQRAPAVGPSSAGGAPRGFSLDSIAVDVRTTAPERAPAGASDSAGGAAPDSIVNPAPNPGTDSATPPPAPGLPSGAP